MREISADAWTIPCDVLCITTNGTINGGKNVMGGGIAHQAAVEFPSLPTDYGRLIRNYGHHVYLIRDLLMFPTKNEVWEKASLNVIHMSIHETKILARLYGWTNIVLPRPGSGLGGLDWHSYVKPSIEPFLDDRFLIVSYPGEA